VNEEKTLDMSKLDDILAAALDRIKPRHLKVVQKETGMSLQDVQKNGDPVAMMQMVAYLHFVRDDPTFTWEDADDVAWTGAYELSKAEIAAQATAHGNGRRPKPRASTIPPTSAASSGRRQS
jgi:hypothetical protein